MDTRWIAFYGKSRQFYMGIFFIFSAKKESWDSTGGGDEGHFSVKHFVDAQQIEAIMHPINQNRL